MKRRKQEMQMIVWNRSRCMLLHAFRRMIFCKIQTLMGVKPQFSSIMFKGEIIRV